MLWGAGIVLIGEILIVLALRRINRSFGAYTERLERVHNQNIEIRKNLCIEKNQKAVSYIIDNSTEKEA